jgi:hypothetical protein
MRCAVSGAENLAPTEAFGFYLPQDSKMGIPAQVVWSPGGRLLIYTLGRMAVLPFSFKARNGVFHANYKSRFSGQMQVNREGVNQHQQ